MAYVVQFMYLINNMFQNFADIDDHPQIIFNSLIKCVVLSRRFL